MTPFMLKHLYIECECQNICTEPLMRVFCGKADIEKRSTLILVLPNKVKIEQVYTWKRT